jgi:hypothetical protein
MPVTLDKLLSKGLVPAWVQGVDGFFESESDDVSALIDAAFLQSQLINGRRHGMNDLGFRVHQGSIPVKDNQPYLFRRH